MTAAEAERMLDRSAAQRQKGKTRPTFNEAVSWQCHQKLWRRHSKAFFANGRLWKQLLSRVPRGQKCKYFAEASTKSTNTDADSAAKVREGKQTVLLLGPRGSGKTTIAARLVRRFSQLHAAGWIVLGTPFTCFTGTKVQILTG
jgi:flagellar biosynthesis GTPase FlhF